MPPLRNDPVVAFTAGSGEPFETLGAVAAARFEQLNRIPTVVLSPQNFRVDQLRSPHWVKAFLWELVGDDTQTIVWFDADIVPLQPLGDLPASAFAAVLDLPAMNGVQTFMHEGKPLKPYFNSGLFVASRESEPAFHQLARDMIQMEKPDRFEQSAFNIRVREVLGGFHQLPLTWNWFHGFYDRMAGPPTEAVRMMHFIRMIGSNRWKALVKCYDDLGIILPGEVIPWFD